MFKNQSHVISALGLHQCSESYIPQDTMMIGADYYQTEAEIAASLAEGRVPVGVGKDTKIM